jgi:hypothetical protein
MKNIHDPAVLQEIKDRLDGLKTDSKRQWGKMDVAQMLAHCSVAIEGNLGDRKIKQTLMGKIFGRMAKKSVVNDEPFKRGLPTDPSFIIKDHHDFDIEKQRLAGLITRLSASDPGVYAQIPHPFFGKLTPNEWNMFNYKHLDHHFRQFGA